MTRQENAVSQERFLKYILMGIVVYVAARYIPENLISQKELLMISAISSIAFAIIDMLSPTIKINKNKR